VINLIIQLLISLPDLLKLLDKIDKSMKVREVDGKIKDDIKKINEAFANQDAAALNAIFNPVVPVKATDDTKPGV
jgi:hypothetical protein